MTRRALPAGDYGVEVDSRLVAVVERKALADLATDGRLLGADDATLLAAAHAADRVLVTLDRGLGERALRTTQHRGVVVLRPRTQSVDDVIATPLPFLATDPLPDLTAYVDDARLGAAA